MTNKAPRTFSKKCWPRCKFKICGHLESGIFRTLLNKLTFSSLRLACATCVTDAIIAMMLPAARAKVCVAGSKLTDRRCKAAPNETNVAAVAASKSVNLSAACPKVVN